MKKLLLVTIMSSFFLVACGGGDGGNSNIVTPPLTNEDGGTDTNTTPDEDKTEEELLQDRLVKEYNLPPEPDPEVNNATIQGVDSNNNEIRDDWERAIVFKYHEDSTKLALMNALAKNRSQINDAYEANDVEKYKDLLMLRKEINACSYFLYGMDAHKDMKIKRMGNNTDERLDYELDKSSDMSEYLDSSFYEGLSVEKKEEVCPKYQQ